MQEPLCQFQHRVWDSLRRHTSRQQEARRHVTFGGLGDGADRPASHASLQAASRDWEKPLLPGLRVMWTAARASGHGTRASAACPHCGAAHEDEAHILWYCPWSGNARRTWLFWLDNVAGPSPA